RLSAGDVSHFGFGTDQQPGTGELQLDLPQRGDERALVVFEHPGLHRARLPQPPASRAQTKQIGYYSDMYKLEFALPKFGMYRRILAQVLAEDFVRDRGWSEEDALELG